VILGHIRLLLKAQINGLVFLNLRTTHNAQRTTVPKRTTYNVQPTTFSDSLNQSMDEACHRQALDEAERWTIFAPIGSRFTCFRILKV
jgi:hypothetical protein